MLEEIGKYELRDKEISARTALSSKARNTKHFVAKENGHEIGFLSLDINPTVDYLVLYEIFVPRYLRNKGHGSKLLSEVESKAASLSYRRVTVNPEPFENDYPKTQLIKWYQKHGYSEMPTGTGEFEKVVNETST